MDYTVSVTVDENGGQELTGESTVSLTDGTVVVRTSATGVGMDIDDFHGQKWMCTTPPAS